MKTTFLSCLFLMLPFTISAQDASPEAADTTAKPATEHILFEGVEVKGDIYTFYRELEHHGFKLIKRLADTEQYAMRGKIAGNTCDFLISYSHETRTVYRIMARPKRVNIPAYLDSLKVRYGEPYDFEDETYKWMTPNGMVMFKTPDDYDPTLLILDALGVKAYKEEEDSAHARMPNGA